jgi:putative transposase
MRPTITNLRRGGDLTDEDAKALYVVGLKLISKPWKFVSQEHIDAYNGLLDAYGGNKPCVRSSIPMRLSEMTGRLEDPGETTLGDFWLRISTLKKFKSVWLPLVGNPYVQKALQVGKGISARKTKLGRWRFEAVDKSTWEAPTASPAAERLGIDIGLNVLATSSDGTLYGSHVKPKFDRLYARLRNLRANRQRQGLKENSPKLDCLESKLSGFIKTETGRIANDLIRVNPDTIFVVEDLDLSGCRGQKRFAYRALQTNLERKVPVQKVNPAYTSQECLSCGYVSRRNRSGVKFTCRSCGRQAHADWVGASNILRRSGDKNIGCGDHPRTVKRVLRERYNLR